MPAVTITVRSSVEGPLQSLLKHEGITCPTTVEAFLETIISLSRYREEDIKLFPQVFLTTNRANMGALLQGAQFTQVGRGPLTAETVRLAIKQCAPLAQGSWAIYIERTVKGFDFGLFRLAGNPLAIDPSDSIISSSCAIVMAHQIAEHVVEVRGSSGHYLRIQMTHEHPPFDVPRSPIQTLVRAATRAVPQSLIEPTTTYLSRALTRIVQTGHGTLCVVIPARRRVLSVFEDCIELTPPLDPAQYIAEHSLAPNFESTLALQGVATLLRGMMNSDGITVLDTRARIRAYRAFISQPASRKLAQRAGGARRRAFDAIKDLMGRPVVAALYRSTDGQMLAEAIRNV